jgi:two-component system cell cycle response regulator CtrA
VSYDIILMDSDLPDMSGQKVLEKMRTSGVKTPVMMLSEDHSTKSIVTALGMGADDFLTKPFHKDEMIARIHAIVRRSNGHANNVINIGPLEINLNRREASADGSVVGLTGREYDVLEVLALNKGQNVSKAMILEHLYGGVNEPEQKIVDVYACKVRKKLEDVQAGTGKLIETIWGKGYRLSDNQSNALAAKFGEEAIVTVEEPETAAEPRQTGTWQRRTLKR